MGARNVAEILAIKDLQDGRLDVKSLGEAANGDENTIVTTRTGETYPSAKRAINIMFQNGGLPAKPFPTLAKMQTEGASLPDDSYAMVTNEKGVDAINNGLYTKSGGVWAKTIYDPLTLAKADATTKADAAKTEAIADSKTYTDSKEVDAKLEYLDDANLAHQFVETLIGKSLRYDGLVINGGEMIVMPVTEGDELFIYNSTNTINGLNGSAYAFFTENPSNPSATKLTNIYKQEVIDSKNISVVPVPVGAKYLAANIKQNTYIHQWAIYKNKPSVVFDGTTGTYRLSALNNVPLAREISKQASTDIKQGNIYEDYYHPDNIVAGVISSNGVPNIYPTIALSTEVVVGFPVTEGDVYYMRLPIQRSYPFKIIYVRKKGWYLGTSNIVPSFYIQDAVVVGTAQEGIYKVTVPSGLGIKALLINVKQTKNTDKIDMSATLSIQKNGFNPALVGSLKKGIASIDNLQLVDNVARQQLAQIPTDLNRPVSRFAGKKVFAIGDSITANQSGYVSYVANAMGTTLTNFGSISAKADRMVDIVTAGSGLAKRDSGTQATVWATPDFTDLACAFIMIGTNHLLLTETTDLASLPADTVYNYATTNDYWNKFPNTFVGNIALVIEYIKWKAPQAEIYIISPPHNGNSRANANSLNAPLRAVTDFYSIPFIDGTNRSGISFKLMNDMITPKVYSDDKVHLNAQGNKMFGTFVAQRILSAG